MPHGDIGGMRPDGGDASIAPLVRDSVTWTGCAVFPSVAVIGVAITQLEPAGAPVQVNDTF